VRVALSRKKSFAFDTRYNVSLRYRNHSGVVLATTSGCFPQKVVSASRAAFCIVSAKFRPCALHSHSSQAGLVGHTEIFTFT
jgi:hypothetical protein